MGTKRKGITIRPDDKTYSMIDKISEISGESKNKVITGLLAHTMPYMDEVLKAWELIKDNNPKGLEVLSKQTTIAINEATTAQLDLIEHMRK